MQELRSYQTEAIANVRAAFQTHRRVLMTAPTGSGKSTILAEIIRSSLALGHRVLAIAHRKELIHQLADRVMLNHGIPSGIIMAGEPTIPLLPCQVASIQTLVRRQLPPADLLLIDESHHAKAATYERILAAYPEARVLGCSATPWRLDGKGLGDIFEENVVAATPKGLVELGFLVPATGMAYLAPDLSQVKVTAGDYNQQGLSLAYEKSQVLGDIVEKWMAHCQGKRTIVFASSIENSEKIIAGFRAKGVAAEHLDFRSTNRDDVVKRVRSGETTVVSNVGILGEGVDFPELEVCVLARPTQSLAFYIQMVGRVLRPAPGKEKARIHDHAGCIHRHNFWDMERDYSLTTSKKKQPKGASLKDCPVCGCVNLSSALSCSECGYVWPKNEVEKPMGGDYEELSLEEMRHRMSREGILERLEREAKARGRKPGWCIFELKRLMPAAPFPAAWWRSKVAGTKGAWVWR